MTSLNTNDESKPTESPWSSKPRRDDRWFEFFSRYSLLVVFAALLVFFSVALPESFPTAVNFRLIANESVVIVILAIAATIPLLVGEFDLSVGYVLGLTQALVVGLVSRQAIPVGLAVVIGLVGAALVGIVNGFLVVRLRINALIATLATGSILSGLVFWYTEGQVLFDDIPPGYVAIARTELWGLPLPLYYTAFIAIVATAFFTWLPTGRRMYATGGNRVAAHLSGIRVNRVIVASFVASAVLSGIGGIIISSRLASAQPGLGPQFLLPAFAAAFLGATAIKPGRFNILGSVIAVYVLAVPISGLQQLGVPSWFEPVFHGLALVVAVALSNQIAVLRQARARREQLQSIEHGETERPTKEGGLHE